MQQISPQKRISLAPMLDKTVPCFRFLIRKLFPEIQLYTEMISSGAIIHGSRRRFLQLEEPPIALQIGTHSPEEAYQSVKIASEYMPQFNEFNLNVGCPSDRVQNRSIGAILMNDAPLVAEILAAMRQALCGKQALITLKHRLGIQSASISMTEPQQLYRFLEQVAPHSDRLIVHARIAMLDGLNPKENREIPPLNYPLVFQIQKNFAPVELNGGLKNLRQIEETWPHVDGLMLGRVSYEDTWQLQKIRHYLLENKLLKPCAKGVRKRSELVEHYCQYLAEHPSRQSLSAQIWPLLSLWYALPEAKHWRRLLSPPYPRQIENKGEVKAKILAEMAHKYILQLERKYPQYA